jgi:tight adherence protein C
LFCSGVSQFVQQRSMRRSLIAKIRGAGDRIDHDAPSDDSTQPASSGSLLKIFAKIGGINPTLVKAQEQTSTRLRFLRAGIRHDNAPAVFWGLKIFLTFLLPAAFLILKVTFSILLSQQVAIAAFVCCALLGFYIPDIWLKQKSDKRKQKLLESLPDALDLLVICVEAGMGLDSAISRVAQEIRLSCAELSDELQFMNLELRAGKQRQEALRSLALRTDLDEINSLATLLIQTDKFGTSLADALRVYADTYRTERYQKAEELAAKLPVKLLFPLVAFIFPALFVVLLGPAAISIYNALVVK